MSRDYITQAAEKPFRETDLPLPNRHKGKVRDLYPLEDGELLLVTTDRLSAFDRILGLAPYKGQVLNQLSAFWFDKTEGIIPNHKISVPDPNATLARKAKTLPVEVVIRGYITGVTKTALWYRYDLGERIIYGHEFPDGMRKNQALSEPIITPTTKGGLGAHDERLTCAEVVDQGHLDGDTWEKVQQASLDVFRLGQQVAQEVGLILVDTKYEFGVDENGEVIIIDEVHTPDSSRFWLAESYVQRFKAGEEPENYDKEFLRLDYAAQGYRGDGEPPEMGQAFWLRVAERYVSLYEKLTGEPFQPAAYPVGLRLEENLRASGILK